MSQETSVVGIGFLGEELEPSPVAIWVKDGIICSIEEQDKVPDQWILPGFFNAHTHIGDTVAMDTPVTGDLAAIVAPPDGIKHQILRRTSHDSLVSAMRATIGVMEECGTAGFADFREGGRTGVDALQEAAAGSSCRPLIFGRDGGELHADGFGISSVRDVADLERQVAEVRKTGGLVAIHAGERDADDIEGALAYEPDLLIHCTHAGKRDLRYCADADIPICVCPRSNWILGVSRSHEEPPVEEMVALGCRVFLGTDNAMFVQPDPWREMSFLRTMTDLPARTILRMAIAGSGLTKTPYWIEEGRKATFMRIDASRTNLKYTQDAAQTLVSRVGCNQVNGILF